MIFIFDWGHQTQNQIGPVAKEDLPYNVKSDFLYLTKTQTWFRMFFIPTIPTKTVYSFLSNPPAETIEISKNEFLKYKPLARLNQKVVLNKISEEEYEKARKNLNFDLCAH